MLSHRSRGAWIEMRILRCQRIACLGRIAHAVRGLKFRSFAPGQGHFLSHRSRGAWIEIALHHWTTPQEFVASLTRCVD